MNVDVTRVGKLLGNLLAIAGLPPLGPIRPRGLELDVVLLTPRDESANDCLQHEHV